MESNESVSSDLQQIHWDELDKSKYYVLGPSMLLAVRAAVYPSNLVKTRLQVQSSRKPLYNGAFDAFRKIARNEGFLGFYKGFSASTLNVVFGNLYISVYEMTRSFVRVKCQVSDTASNLFGGAVASLISQTVVVPLDIVSQRLMVSEQLEHQHQKKYSNLASAKSSKSMSSVIRTIYQSEGLRGFYRGYFVSIATYAPSSSIWWGSYGFILPIYFNWFQSWNIDNSWKQVLAQASSGGTSGVITAILTNPLDIVRTKRQIYTDYSTMQTLEYILKREGSRGLMTGVVARIMSMGPSGLLIITTYELVKRLSRKSVDSSLEVENDYP
uniref:Mitochondrial Carrier (MC) Family putative n=1 Tax=Albugo laibachii Nc14 TaxID=890382 RepID=F0W7W1_9STRA|nr:Mitochondrial Carrier (MC) Family putative [Albugo laibachii Nc14]CCA23689.1 Mitochondrial Carrier (MC) Family putative [Albugo laibachii Nc14]|eukprot:CCA23689.1 Mitochondrial Carrier (MC) Family putative [Albugo laibachii Nc14]